MSANSVNSRLDRMEALLEGFLGAVTGQAGAGKLAISVGAKSTSKGKQADVSIDPDTVVIQVTAKDGRIKLTKRMFNSKGVTYVDGVKYRSLESDAGRSAPINADDVFDAPKGSIIEFTRSGKNEWVSEVLDAKPKGKGKGQAVTVKTQAKSTSPSKPKFQSKRTPEQQAEWDNAPVHAITGNRKRDIKKMLDVVSDQIVENCANKKFVPNQAILETDAKKAWDGVEIDPRIYLTKPQHNRFKRANKKLGLSTEESVRMLNDLLNFA